MKAVVYKGKNEVAVEEIPDPKIEGPTDAITKITTAAICVNIASGFCLNCARGLTGLCLSMNKKVAGAA